MDKMYKSVSLSIVLVICILCIYYMYRMRHSLAVNSTMMQANKIAEFTPTYFRIYDKSTDDVCNRLVVVEPFGWYLWASNGELYVLNPEATVHCSNNATPAVRVFRHVFVETCLSLSFDSVVSSYTNVIRDPVLVPYKIETTTFTILDAINILLKSWLKFDEIELKARPVATTTDTSDVDETTTVESVAEFGPTPAVEVVDLTRGVNVGSHSRKRRSIDITNDDDGSDDDDVTNNGSADVNAGGSEISGRRLAQMMNQGERRTRATYWKGSKQYSLSELTRIYNKAMARINSTGREIILPKRNVTTTLKPIVA